ncbi:MAG TPA: hypothetical protein ENI80_09100 [Acidiferrobacteraceae bacterium]|nr:hypothetical protein [Acidiferrobacteraceae bacterium]
MGLQKWMVLLGVIYGGIAMAEQKSVTMSKEFVSHLGQDCTLTDGYVCLNPEEDDFLRPSDNRKLVPGPYLQAWPVAYKDFLGIEELNDSQKQLKHYRIGFTEDANHYIIHFGGLMLPHIVDGKPTGVMGVTYGLSMKYWIDKKSLKVKKRLFYK